MPGVVQVAELLFLAMGYILLTVWGCHEDWAGLLSLIRAYLLRFPLSNLLCIVMYFYVL